MQLTHFSITPVTVSTKSEVFLYLTPPIEVYPPINERKHFAPPPNKKFCQIFKLSPMKHCTIKFKFINQKNEKVTKNHF